MRDDGIRPWRAVIRLLARVPLRVRLVAMACCLVAAAAVIISMACVLTARTSLMRHADQELRAYTAVLTSRPFTALPAGPGPGAAADDSLVVEVVEPGGHLVMRTGADTRPAPVIAGSLVSAGRPVAVPAASGGGSWLVVAEPVHYRAHRIPFTYGSEGFWLRITSPARPGTAGTLVVGLDLSGVAAALTAITVGCAAVSCAAVAAIALAGFALMRAMLRPLARMRSTAAGFAAGTRRRVPAGHHRGAAGTLARPLDTMLHRVEQARDASASRLRTARDSTDRMRAAIAATAEQLRRPLSVIGGAAEYYRQRRPLGAHELDRMMERVADECARMDAVIDDLARVRCDHARPPEAGGRAGRVR